jgi:tetratricopeptide (TPR) repeat protein
MATTPKPPGAAEIAALEHAFAADPASEAYRPLAEAYLAAGRFMEAMVVGKKGVKAHPDDPSAKLLLARVYAGQGKDRKALDEVTAILAAFPGYAAGARLAAELHYRLGQAVEGEAALRRAAGIAPDDPETRALLQKHGMEVRAPEPPPAVAAPAPAQAAGGSGGPPVLQRVAAAPRAAQAGLAAGAPASVPAPDVPAARAAAAPASAAHASAAPARAAAQSYSDALAEKYATQEYTLTGTGEQPVARRRSRGPVVATAALALVLPLALGGWYLWSRAHKERALEIDRLLRETKDLVDQDGFAAYQAASGKAAEILKLDGDSLAGHAYRAYVSAVLAVEHGAGDAVRTEAVRHVQAARALGQRHSHLVAAEAYLRAGAGEQAEALKDLQAVLGGDDGAQSPFLRGVQGAIELASGDLDGARETLGAAQKQNPGDVRVASLLGEQFRRRGDGYEALAVGFHEYALRIRKDHVGALLGKAAVLVERGQSAAAAQLVEQALAPAAGASPRQRAFALAVKGIALHAQGDAAGGDAAEAEAARTDPTLADVPHLLGRRKLRAGDAAGAVEAFQRALGTDPRRVAVHADLVRALLAQEGGAQKAIDAVKKAQARLGETPRLALLLGDAYRAAGDADLARGQYEKAMKLGSPFPDARVALARLLREQRNVPGALVELTQAIDEYGTAGSGGAARAFVEMAETERARGAKPELVLGLYEKALERDRASCDALWGAGRLGFEAEKLTDGVRGRLEAYVRDCPRAPNVEEAKRLLGR